MQAIDTNVEQAQVGDGSAAVPRSEEPVVEVERVEGVDRHAAANGEEAGGQNPVVGKGSRGHQQREGNILLHPHQTVRVINRVSEVEVSPGNQRQCQEERGGLLSAQALLRNREAAMGEAFAGRKGQGREEGQSIAGRTGKENKRRESHSGGRNLRTSEQAGSHGTSFQRKIAEHAVRP